MKACSAHLQEWETGSFPVSKANMAAQGNCFLFDLLLPFGETAAHAASLQYQSGDMEDGAYTDYARCEPEHVRDA